MKCLIPIIAVLIFIGACSNDDIDVISTSKQIDTQILEEKYQRFLSEYDNPARAREILSELKQISQEAGSDEYMAKYYSATGYLFHIENKVGEAAEAYINSLEFYTKINDRYGLAKALNNIGDEYRRASYTEASLGYLKRAELLFIEVEREDWLPTVYLNIALDYAGVNEYEMAMEYVDKGISLANTYQKQSSLAELYNAKGKVYFDQNEFSHSREMYTLSIQHTTENNLKERARAISNIAESYVEEGNTQLANSWIEKAMVLKEQIGDPILLLNTETLKAKLHSNDPNVVLNTLSAAIDKVPSNVHVEGLSDALQLITSSEKLINEQFFVSHAKSFLAISQIKMDQILYLEALNDKLKLLKDQYEIKLAEERHRNEVRTKELSESNFRNIITIVTLSAIIIFTLVAFCIYWRSINRKNKRVLKRYHAAHEEGLRIIANSPFRYGYNSPINKS